MQQMASVFGYLVLFYKHVDFMHFVMLCSDMGRPRASSVRFDVEDSAFDGNHNGTLIDLVIGPLV